MAFTHRVSTPSSTNNAATYASGSFTPAVGELLVAMAYYTAGTQVDTTPAMSDSKGLGWTLVGFQEADNHGNGLAIFVANALVASATSMTVTLDVSGGTGNTGAEIAVVGLSGMTKVGAAAILQSNFKDKALSGGNSTTPFAAFGANAQTGNPTLAAVGGAGLNPLTITPPTGWTEKLDTGYNTPTTGFEYATRDSGFTGTTITWGSTAPGRWQAGVIEFDISSGGGATVTGAVSTALTLSRTTAGHRRAKAASASSLTTTLTVAGHLGARAASSLPLTLGVTTLAHRGAKAAAALPLSLAVTASAKRRTFAAAAQGFTLGLVTSARRRANAALSLPLTLAATVAATASGAIEGAVSLALSVTFGSSGHRRANAASAFPLSLSATTAGRRRALAATAAAVVLGITTAARRRVSAAAASALALGITTTGLRRVRGAASTALSFVAQVAGTAIRALAGIPATVELSDRALAAVALADTPTGSVVLTEAATGTVVLEDEALWSVTLTDQPTGTVALTENPT